MKKYILFLIAALVCGTGAMAQKTITGTVKDEQGEAIIGATILVKNTSSGAVTDPEGKFTLNFVKDDDVLQVASLGHLSQDVAVGAQSELSIVLKSDTYKLDEIVAIGYGTSRRGDLTGSIGSVSAADIVRTPTSNYDQALAGRIAGVQVSSVDGTPGEGLNIVIRGGNSITGDNSPLYVVDGIPLEDFDPATISANDIKDFNVLKDASATAIYGSRGANGVILITTKSGRSDGRVVISAGASYGAAWIPTRLAVMGPYDYVRYQQEIAYAQDGYNPTSGMSDSKVRNFMRTWVDPELYRNVKGTNWQDEIFRTAPFSKINVTLSSGTERSSIYYSGEWLDQQGTLLSSSFSKLINNLKVTQKIGESTTITGQVQYTYSKNTGLSVSGNSYTSVIRDAIQFRPVEPIQSDGLEEGGYDPDDQNYKYLSNPVQSLNYTDRRARTDVVRGNLMISRKIGKHLTLRLSGNYLIDSRRNSTFFAEGTQSARTGTDGINGSITHSRTQTVSTSNTLTYAQKFNKIHDVTVLGGFEASKRANDNFMAKNTLFPTDIFGIDKLQVGTSPSIPTSYAGANTLASFFGRVNYNLCTRYLFSANFRADGSSKFSPENRWGYFPSVSAAWRLSDERFLKHIDWMSNLKLRASWGLTGNNRIGDYDWISYLNLTSTSGAVWGNGKGYIPGAIQANLGVPDLRWETTAQSNVGLDASFFGQRIDLTVDLYEKRTRDLLLNADMALSSGFDKVQQNVGKITNRGLEFTVSSINVNKPNFQWFSSFNISFNRTKVLQLNRGQQAIYTDPNFYFNVVEHAYITQLGSPVGMIYGLQFDGIYQWDDFNYDATTGVFTRKPGVPTNGSTVAPGSVKFVDRDGNGIIDSQDRTIIGNPNPKHFGGFTNDFVIAKNIDVQLFLQWSYGNDILNATRSLMGVAGSNRYNALAEVANFWTPYNTQTNINGVRYETIFGAAPKGNQIDDRCVEDGSYLRLKSVSVGYTFPYKWTSKLSLNKVRVYASGQNLLTWTNYSGYDPDVSVGKYGALTPGLDYSAYPQSVTMVFGIDLSF